MTSEDDVRTAVVEAASIREALEAASTPVAVRYYPLTESRTANHRTVPVIVAALQPLAGVANAVNPGALITKLKQVKIYWTVMPEGTELVGAAGTRGYRGFVRGVSRIARQPVFNRVSVAPILASAGAAMLAAGVIAHRKEQARYRRVEALLVYQEERSYVERIKDLRSADAQLSRAISSMLDGHKARSDSAVKSAYDEFYRSQQFLEKARGVVSSLVGDDGKVDYHRLPEALGGTARETGRFMRELHLAHAAIAIGHKATIAEAAAAAFADPSNPFVARRKLLQSQLEQLHEAGEILTELTGGLTDLGVEGRRHEADRAVPGAQKEPGARFPPSGSTGTIRSDTGSKTVSARRCRAQ